MAVDYGIAGHVAIVTGSTSGIGRALAGALAEQGVNVILNGLGDPAAIEADRRELQARTNAAIRYHAADMTKPDEIADLIDYAVREFGRLDILVNNAGIQHVSPIEDFPPEKWDALMAIILSSTFHTTRAAVPIMKAQGRGRIVNIASAHGLVASPFKSAYVAAKFGVVGFTKAIGVELARTGVTCNAICPGWVLTPLVQKQIDARAAAEHIPVEQAKVELLREKEPSLEFTTPDELGQLAVFFCSPAGNNVRGVAWNMDGGWAAQ